MSMFNKIICCCYVLVCYDVFNNSNRKVFMFGLFNNNQMVVKLECWKCSGWGWLDNNVTKTCPVCSGIGSVDEE